MGNGSKCNYELGLANYELPAGDLRTGIDRVNVLCYIPILIADLP